MYLCCIRHKYTTLLQYMSDKSSTAVSKDKMIRLSELYPMVEKSAIQDSAIDKTLYTVPQYVRDIVEAFLDLKKQDPSLTPKTFKEKVSVILF